MSPELKNLLEVFIHLGGAGFLASLLWRIVGYFASIKTAIEALGTQLAVIIERVEGHEKRLENLERR